MSSKIESLVENIFARSEKAAQKPIPGAKGKPVKNDPGVEVHFKKPKKSKFAPMKKAVVEAFLREEEDDSTKAAFTQGLMKHMGKTTKGSIEKSGGDTGAYDKIKKGKDARKAVNMAPVHYQPDTKTGGDSKRRDLKAGPKGHSAKNTFEKKGKRQAQADKFSKGTKTAGMSKDAINQSGVEGQYVKKDGQSIPSKRWSALKGAMANRKFNRSMKGIPDGN